MANYMDHAVKWVMYGLYKVQHMKYISAEGDFAESSNRGEESSKGKTTKHTCKKTASKEGCNVIEDVGKSTSDQYSALKKFFNTMLTRHCKEYK
eukprot:15365783-Ditylum_brightwellii.AAC.1